MKFRYLIILAVFGALVFYFYKFHPVKNSTETGVVTSFYPLYFFTTQIAGDKASVYNITPAGAEPHDYEPTTQDVARIEDSKLLIINGGKLEPWGDSMTASLKGSQTTVVVAGNNGVGDPHVWLDPVLAKNEVAAILNGLTVAFPTNADYYKTNAQNLENKLDALDAEYRTGLSSCQKKDFVTAHAAFGYLAKEYGLNQVAISGISPDEEPSPQKLTEVADFVKTNNIKYIFFESLTSPKLSDTIARETGAQTLVLNPLEGLTNAEISQGKNYFTVMTDNLNNLRIALQCQ
ncbi:MAG: metal ABC transporter substrate-binding protein [Patescibacteria group bacterium]